MTVLPPSPSNEFPTVHVGIVWNQHSIASTATATVDALRTVNMLALIRSGCTEPPLRWHWMRTPGEEPELAPVPMLVAGEVACEDAMHLIVLPGWLVATGPALRDVSQRHAAHWQKRLQKHVNSGRPVAALFNGSSLLAGCGLLAGRKAALPWVFAPSIVLQSRESGWLEPVSDGLKGEVQWQRERAWQRDVAVWTSASLQETMSLILDVLASTPLAELAQAAASVLSFDPQRQLTASLALETPTGSPLRAGSLELARRWLQTHRNAPYSLEATARAAATSPRTLLRWFDQVYGQSPQDYLHGLRVTQAQGLLQTTYLTVEDVAQQCGYSDTGSFRKIFKRLSGDTPGNYRRRFSLRTTRKQWAGAPVKGQGEG